MELGRQAAAGVATAEADWQARIRCPLVAVRRVVVIMAMEAEAEPVLAAVNAQQMDTPAWAAALPTQLYVALVDKIELVVAVNGVDPATGVDCVGTQAAALSTQVAIAAHAPDLVISAGTAGGYQRHGAEIGDAYLAWPSLVHHDRRIALPVFDEFGRGEHPAADLRSVATALGLRTAIVTTGNSLDETATDAEWILASGAEVKEMEAAAVAWVSRLNEIPVSAVKVITDLVDAPAATEVQFVANLEFAVGRLSEVLLAVVSRLGGLELDGARE